MGGRVPLLRSLLSVELCALCYLYVFPYHSEVNNPNENVRLYMTAALSAEGTYAIDALRERWGWVNDAAVHDGHVFSVKAPGTSLLGVLPFTLHLAGSGGLDSDTFDRTTALWLCRLWAVILPTLVWLFFFHRVLAARTTIPVVREAVFFSVALGSLLYGYGLMFVSHTPSAVAAFTAFALLETARVRGGNVSTTRAFFAGLSCAAITWLEYPGLVASIVLMAYALVVLWPRGGMRSIAAYAVGGTLPALSMMHFQWRAFGSPFTPGHLFVESASLREAHHEGLYGMVGPSLHALYGLLLDPAAGLLPLTPILIAAPLGWVWMTRDRAQRGAGAALMSTTALTVLAIASMNNWRGGWTIGPRYLALCVPLLGYAALVGLDRVAARAPRLTAGFAIGATASALLASGIPSAYYPHLPLEFTRPLPQLAWVLIREGYAPYNLGATIGMPGAWSMLPLAACGVGVLALCLWSVAANERLAVAAIALVVSVTLTTPLVIRPRVETGVAEAVGLVKGRWSGPRPR